jgi:hypothetical protein
MPAPARSDRTRGRRRLYRCVASTRAARVARGTLLARVVLRRPVLPAFRNRRRVRRGPRDAHRAATSTSRRSQRPTPRRSWPTKRELGSAVFEYIEAFYNRERRHSTLGMHSPHEYEELLYAAKNNDVPTKDIKSKCRLNPGKSRPRRDPARRKHVPSGEPPSSTRMRRVASTRPASLDASTTWSPAGARRRAIANPIPLPPPVTRIRRGLGLTLLPDLRAQLVQRLL